MYLSLHTFNQLILQYQDENKGDDTGSDTTALNSEDDHDDSESHDDLDSDDSEAHSAASDEEVDDPRNQGSKRSGVKNVSFGFT